MHRQFLFLSVLVLVGFAPFAWADSRPNWVDGNPDERFPEQRYLTAVGSGKSREAAAADAKKQLASTFRAKVTSETNSGSESSLSENTKAKVEGEGSEKIQSSVNIQSSVELRGVEVKNYYFDPKTKEHYALATMDKLKAHTSYRLELNKIKEKIEALYARYEEKADISTANEIFALTEQFETLNKEYGVVNNGNGAPAPLTYEQLDKIRANMNNLKTATAVTLEFSGEETKPEFQELITSCLSDKGVAVVAKLEEGKAPPYRVTYNMTEKQKFMDVKGWVKYQFSCLAVVKKGNTLIDRKRISKDATGRDKDNAFDSIKEDFSEQVCAQIAKTVTQ